MDALADGIGRVGALANLHGFRAVKKLFGQFFDIARQGGGKEQGLPALLGEVLHNLTDIGKEAHVEHTVGLVEHKEFQS